MKNIMKKFIGNYGLKRLSGSAIKELIWDEYTTEFVHVVLNDMYDFAGDKLFEIEG